MPKFETLIPDIYALLGGEYSKEDLSLPITSAHRIVGLAKNVGSHVLEMVNHTPPKIKSDADATIRMSEVGEPCIRKLFYKWCRPDLGLPPYAEPSAPTLPLKFTYGDMVEELTLYLAAEAGHKVENRQRRVEVPLGMGDWKLVGHMDAVIDDVVVDVKSAADRSFAKYKALGLTEATDSFGYRWQLDGYAMADGYSRRAFLFTNKQDGEMHVIDRTGDDMLNVVERAQAIVKEVGRGGGNIKRMNTKVTPNGNQLGVVCSYCPFKYSCWSRQGGLTAFVERGRPTYVVTPTITKKGLENAAKAKIPPPKAFV